MTLQEAWKEGFTQACQAFCMDSGEREVIEANKWNKSKTKEATDEQD